MAKLTTAEFIEAIKELSVLELNELVKACEESLAYPQQQALLLQQQALAPLRQLRRRMSSM